MPEGQTGGVCGKIQHFLEIYGAYKLPQSKIFDFCQLPQNEGAEGAPAPGATIQAARQTSISLFIGGQICQKVKTVVVGYAEIWLPYPKTIEILPKLSYTFSISMESFPQF